MSKQSRNLESYLLVNVRPTAEMPAQAPSIMTVESEHSLNDLATCHTSSISGSHISIREASPKSSARMSVSPNHRRMEPYIRPPPMLKEDWLSLEIPDVMKPEAYRIPPRESVLLSRNSSMISAKNLHSLNQQNHASLFSRVKRKLFLNKPDGDGIPSKKSSDQQVHQDDQDASYLLTSPPPPSDLDWLANHHPSTQRSNYLSSRELAAIERWRISVYLTSLLKWN